mgnify:CR=1 FL=1
MKKEYMKELNKIGILIIDDEGSKKFKLNPQDKIIKNINNELVTIYNNNKYVLLEVNTNYQILSKNIKYNSNDYQNLSINHSNWEYLWTIKNDYYDKLNTDNKYIQETKDYYMGLAENALQFIKYNNIKSDEIYLCRLEIIDEKFPTNIILDCKEREIAEIIKKEFFYKNKSIEEIVIELDKIINKYDVKKIIARLLYPNYYFDLYDKFIKQEENIKEITHVISKNKKYEELIKKIYHKYPNDILMIDWLIKD